MTVILVLGTFVIFLVIDGIKTYVERAHTYTTPGFEMLGALAQDGGEPVSTIESEAAETEEILAKMKRTNSAKMAG